MTPHRKPSSMTTSSGSSGSGMPSSSSSSSANSASLRSLAAAPGGGRDGGTDEGRLIGRCVSARLAGSPGHASCKKRRPVAGRRGGDGAGSRGEAVAMRFRTSGSSAGRPCASWSNSSSCSAQLGGPGLGVERRDLVVAGAVEIEAGPVEVLVARRDAERVGLAAGAAFDALDDPRAARACSRRSRARRTCRRRPCGTS